MMIKFLINNQKKQGEEPYFNFLIEKHENFSTIYFEKIANLLKLSFNFHLSIKFL